MRRGLRALVAAIVVATASSVAVPAQANFHLMFVTEVFAGTTDDPDLQFIELQMYTPGQNFVNNHAVTVFDSFGGSDTFTMSSHVPNGSSQDSILLGTAGVSNHFGVTPDFVMPIPAIEASGGKVCFESSDCAEWGDILGTPEPGAIPAGQSLLRSKKGNGTYESTDDTNNSATDFEYGAPAPRNNARVVGNADGKFSFALNAYDAAEGGTDPTITVTRVGTGNAATVVWEETVGIGNATPNADYTYPDLAGRTLSFAAGDNSESFPIAITDDPDDENEETIPLSLTSPSGAGELVNNTTTVTIVDNDGPAEIFFDDEVLQVLESQGNLDIVVQRGGNSSVASSATYTRAVGTATVDEDFTGPANGTASFGSGETTTTFSLSIVDDNVDELSETINYELSDPQNAVLVTPATIAITVLDNDETPDTAKPKSRIGKPLHNRSYARGAFTKLTGTANDGPSGSGVMKVQVAIRQTLKNGKCRWFMGAGFDPGPCSTKKWRNATGTANWTLGLAAFRLPKSNVASSNVAFYTAYSRARDVAGNLESTFVVTRNANKFEIT